MQPNQPQIKDLTELELERIIADLSTAPLFKAERPAVKSECPSLVRPLTAKECQAKLGLSQSVKVNFIPQMICALMLNVASDLVNYCRDHKIKSLRKHTRVMRMAVEEYAREVYKAYGHVFSAYRRYVNRFHAECITQMWMLETHADELCRNQLPRVVHRAIASRTLIVRELIEYIERFDDEMDRMMTKKLGIYVRKDRDEYLQLIHAMCVSIGEDEGYKLTADKAIDDWVKIISNKAWTLADTIISEEAQVDTN